MAREQGFAMLFVPFELCRLHARSRARALRDNAFGIRGYDKSAANGVWDSGRLDSHTRTQGLTGHARLLQTDSLARVLCVTVVEGRLRRSGDSGGSGVLRPRPGQ